MEPLDNLSEKFSIVSPTHKVSRNLLTLLEKRGSNYGLTANHSLDQLTPQFTAQKRL